MSSKFGESLQISIFGESHGKAIGVEMDGVPSGETIDMEKLQAFLDRRKPGQGAMTTRRKESDQPEFLSGILNDTTTGFPICAVIKNSDQHSGDYNNLRTNPRPSHADYTAYLKYGEARDMRGGGHFSGRLTAPLCIAGGICLQILERRGIYVGAHLLQVGTIKDDSFPLYPTPELFQKTASRNPATVNPEAGPKMEDVIVEASKRLDSIGGIIECAITGVPGGVGSPMFEGIENRLAKVLFGIPAVKGVEFGSGFDGALQYGSHNNDPFVIKDQKIATATNHEGGINGGITNGMPIVFRVAVKPTASISQKQQTVNLDNMQETELVIKGRHDPCIAVRAVPVVEAAAAAEITDILLGEHKL